MSRMSTEFRPFRLPNFIFKGEILCPPKLIVRRNFTRAQPRSLFASVYTGSVKYAFYARPTGPAIFYVIVFRLYKMLVKNKLVQEQFMQSVRSFTDTVLGFANYHPIRNLFQFSRLWVSCTVIAITCKTVSATRSGIHEQIGIKIT